MIQNVHLLLPILFGLTTLLTLVLFLRAFTQQRNLALILCVLWLLAQGILSWNGFYLNTFTMPPRFGLMIAPPILCLLILFILPKGRKFLLSMDLRALHALHVVRIPVEFGLLWLFLYQLVPELMTFEGRNFDILSGITAPLIVLFAFVKNYMNRTMLIVWNVICLGLLFNIVINAIFSVPSPFQAQAFEQPNIGVLYFPINYLPGFIVPVVFYAHVISLFQLIKTKS